LGKFEPYNVIFRDS